MVKRVSRFGVGQEVLIALGLTTEHVVETACGAMMQEVAARSFFALQEGGPGAGRVGDAPGSRVVSVLSSGRRGGALVWLSSVGVHLPRGHGQGGGGAGVGMASLPWAFPCQGSE